ncbi:MAG: amidohydrolase family protein [Acidimicrobiia bacterium]|nr:amidohydrolase family protein [Acidimicrobiia bacterium]
MIDPLVNVANAWMAKSSITRRAKAEVFKAGDDFERDLSAAELVERMDRAGIAKAIIGVDPEQPLPWVLEFAASHPDRFAFAAEPRLKHGLEAVWAVEDLCRDHPVVAVRVAPMFVGAPVTDAAYVPTIVKCIELDVPLCLTTGIPGPPGLPADLQHPMALDPVLLAYPQLKVVMLHGADPWWAEAIRLLRRHRNLWMCTSAWPPSRLPEILVAYLRGAGARKILSGSDHPVVTIERCAEEARALGLPPEAERRYLHDNAMDLFFGERHSRHVVHAG